MGATLKRMVGQAGQKSVNVGVHGRILRKHPRRRIGCLLAALCVPFFEVLTPR